MKRSTTALVLLLSAEIAAAAPANRAEAIACRSSDGFSVVSAQSLDAFEAKLRGIIPQFAGAEDLDSKLELMLARMERIAPGSSPRLRSQIEFLARNRQPIPGVILPIVVHPGHRSTPWGCEVESVFLRRDVRFDDDVPYLLSQDLWDRLSEDDRAILVFHDALVELYPLRSLPEIRLLNIRVFSER